MPYTSVRALIRSSSTTFYYYWVRRVKRTRGANGRCGATKTPGATPQTHKGRVTMPHISELYRSSGKKEICEARIGDLKKKNGVLDSSDLGEQIYIKD